MFDSFRQCEFSFVGFKTLDTKLPLHPVVGVFLKKTLKNLPVNLLGGADNLKSDLKRLSFCNLTGCPRKFGDFSKYLNSCP